MKIFVLLILLLNSLFCFDIDETIRKMKHASKHERYILMNKLKKHLFLLHSNRRTHKLKKLHKFQHRKKQHCKSHSCCSKHKSK
jgi:ribosomal protein L29